MLGMMSVKYDVSEVMMSTTRFLGYDVTSSPHSIIFYIRQKFITYIKNTTFFKLIDDYLRFASFR